MSEKTTAEKYDPALCGCRVTFNDFIEPCPRHHARAVAALEALEKLAYRCEAHQDEEAGCPCCDAVAVAGLKAELRAVTTHWNALIETTGDHYAIERTPDEETCWECHRLWPCPVGEVLIAYDAARNKARQIQHPPTPSVAGALEEAQKCLNTLWDHFARGTLWTGAGFEYLSNHVAEAEVAARTALRQAQEREVTT